MKYGRVTEPENKHCTVTCVWLLFAHGNKANINARNTAQIDGHREKTKRNAANLPQWLDLYSMWCNKNS